MKRSIENMIELHNISDIKQASDDRVEDPKSNDPLSWDSPKEYEEESLLERDEAGEPPKKRPKKLQGLSEEEAERRRIQSNALVSVRAVI